jgi:hypothetical protein
MTVDILQRVVYAKCDSMQTRANTMHVASTVNTRTITQCNMQDKLRNKTLSFSLKWKSENNRSKY